jgi:hypothetical protein
MPLLREVRIVGTASARLAAGSRDAPTRLQDPVEPASELDLAPRRTSIRATCRGGDDRGDLRHRPQRREIVGGTTSAPVRATRAGDRAFVASPS